MLGCPRSPYSLQLGPHVLMYNVLETKIDFVYILQTNNIVLYYIVLTNCGNKYFQCFQFLAKSSFLQIKILHQSGRQSGIQKKMVESLLKKISVRVDSVRRWVPPSVIRSPRRGGSQLESRLIA